MGSIFDIMELYARQIVDALQESVFVRRLVLAIIQEIEEENRNAKVSIGGRAMERGYCRRNLRSKSNVHRRYNIRF